MQLTFFSFITDMNEPMDMNNVNAFNENGFKIDYRTMAMSNGCRIPPNPARCNTGSGASGC